jgi:hypothetical protein
LQVVIARTFFDEHLNLNDVYARRCTFDGCVLELWRGRRPCDVQQCKFDYCLLVGDGWPPSMLAEAKWHDERNKRHGRP